MRIEVVVDHGNDWACVVVASTRGLCGLWSVGGGCVVVGADNKGPGRWAVFVRSSAAVTVVNSFDGYFLSIDDAFQVSRSLEGLTQRFQGVGNTGRM